MFAAEDRWLVELLKSTRSVRTRRAARAGEYECAGRCLISSLPFATCAEGFSHLYGRASGARSAFGSASDEACDEVEVRYGEVRQGRGRR